jgi:hypothetical protein
MQVFDGPLPTGAEKAQDQKRRNANSRALNDRPAPMTKQQQWQKQEQMKLGDT